jgi:hypothetical protein
VELIGLPLKPLPTPFRSRDHDPVRQALTSTVLSLLPKGDLPRLEMLARVLQATAGEAMRTRQTEKELPKCSKRYELS